MISTQVKPPRRDASRFEDRVAARPDRAVVLAAAGALAATVLTHYSAAALLRTVSSDKGGLHVTPSSRRRVDRWFPRRSRRRASATQLGATAGP